MRYKTGLLTICLLVTACNIRPLEPEFRPFSDKERQQIEEMRSGTVEAFVADSYRAVGVLDEQAQDNSERSKTGLVLFAKCDGDITFEECHDARPTVERPHAYIKAIWHRKEEGTTTVAINELTLHWQVEQDSDILDCTSKTFQLNPYSITQIPRVLGNFFRGGLVLTGNKEIDLPPNPDRKSPHRVDKKTTWTCTYS